MKPARTRLGVAIAAALASIATVAAVAAPSAHAKPPARAVSTEKALYVVQMLDLPVVAYDGSIKGLPATKPAAGQKINPNSTKVKKYAAYLDASHAGALAKVGGRKVYDYRFSFNGFAAELTEAGAVKLAGLPNVVAVTKNELLQLDTADTPEFLGLSDEGGLWEQLGGPETGKKQGGAGEGVIIGVVDSGIWPESASFSDRDDNGKLVYQQIPGWHGKCTPGEAFAASMCNQKLIGAQYFNAGFGGNAGVDASFVDAYEFNSPRDADGHGTHTASTAGGNYGVDTGISVAGVELGAISGMAPRARIAAYKACWGIPPDGGCATVDTVAAIDQAVADGVDVINYSISGSQNAYLDPVEVAFLFAADAGIFVAASAGNEGPGAETLNHPSPWLTTVAASTHNRVAVSGGSLGNGVQLQGASVAEIALTDYPLVASTDVGLPGVDPVELALCFENTLDPDKVRGKIVACDRGEIARVDKSAEVLRAEGAGMFLMNKTPTETLNADNHSVPTLHVNSDARTQILDYIGVAGPSATASILAAELSFAGEPEMAGFSSRGPIFGGVEDVLKPDITAPGVDVLAAVSPYSSAGDFDFLSGTSMSSPHMAGIAALMVDAHPTWSPMMIKSALMTSAHQDVLDNGEQADAFDFGAGHVAPNSAVSPGLVYDSGWIDWLGFLCGTGQLTELGDSNGNGVDDCVDIAIDPSNLNQASIAVGSLAGSQTVTRTVTNVGDATATYDATVTGVDGVDVDVQPSSLTIAPGKSAEFTVTFTTLPGATVGEYTEGALTWSDGSHTVRSPVVVRPVALAAPAEVFSTSGPIGYQVGFGTGGTFSATPAGLVAAVQAEGSVLDDPTNNFATAPTGTYTIHLVEVLAGSTMARFSLFDDYTDGEDDLDLYVYDSSGSVFLGGSGSGTSAEQVDLDFGAPLAANAYFLVVVHGWQTDGPSADYTLFSWGLPSTSAGDMTVTAPATAVLGGTGNVGITISPLAAGEKYIGAVNYAVTGNPVGRTIVRVDTD